MPLMEEVNDRLDLLRLLDEKSSSGPGPPQPQPRVCEELDRQLCSIRCNPNWGRKILLVMLSCLFQRFGSANIFWRLERKECSSQIRCEYYCDFKFLLGPTAGLYFYAVAAPRRFNAATHRGHWHDRHDTGVRSNLYGYGRLLDSGNTRTASEDDFEIGGGSGILDLLGKSAGQFQLREDRWGLGSSTWSISLHSWGALSAPTNSWRAFRWPTLSPYGQNIQTYCSPTGYSLRHDSRFILNFIPIWPILIAHVKTSWQG